MNKERVFTGGVPPHDISRLMIVYHADDSKDGDILAGRFAGSQIEVAIYRPDDLIEGKVVVERFVGLPVEIVMVDAASYIAGNPSYEDPTNILIFVNHAVIPPQDKIYKSAFSFLWKSSDAVTLTSTDMTLLDTNKVTLLQSDFDPAMILNTPNFTPHARIEDANRTLTEYKNAANTYKVGESRYKPYPKPTINTPNYDDDYFFSINSEDIYMQEKLMAGQPWEKKHTALMSAYVQPNSIVLDIGANIGTVAVLLSRAVRSKCVVYAFEPFPYTHALLQRNIEDNKCKNVVAFPVCVGDKYRPVVKLPAPDPKHTTVAQLGTNGIAVRMLTIDQILSDNDHVSVMKVDVEGAEPLVFYGARETIRRCMPVIFYERNSQQIDKKFTDDMGIPDEIVNFDIVVFCHSLGYRDLRQMSPDNYMLVPPNREMTTPNSIITFGPFKPNDPIKNHAANTLTDYTLLEGSHAKWSYLQKNNEYKEQSWLRQPANSRYPRQPAESRNPWQPAESIYSRRPANSRNRW
jgi:FkbM family methyltransferase